MRATEGQSLIDLCIKQYGTLEAIFNYALHNDMGLDTELLPGQQLNPVDFVPMPSSYEQPPILPAPKRYTCASEGQNLVDVVIQECGSLEGIIGLAMSNGFSLDTELAPGQLLHSSTEMEANPNVAGYFRNQGMRINTDTNYTPPTESTKPLKDWDAADYIKKDWY